MLRLAGVPVLVVGGGEVAARKVAGLRASGALVTVVAPDVVPALREDTAVEVRARPYERGDVAGHRLVVTATDDPAVNQAVFDDAERAGIWVNSADDPLRCSFILPAVTRRGPVTVAVGTGGTSPALAGWLRDRLAAALPGCTEELARRLAGERDELHAAGRSTEGYDWRRRIEGLLTELGEGSEPHS
jgi:siroheme synthase-like protein